MNVAAWLLMTVVPGDPLILRESVRLEGRFVRLIDLIDSRTLDEETRGRLAGIYLGRVPEAGTSRTITVEGIRRQLDFRGLDASRFRFSREEVLVRGAGEPPAREGRRPAGPVAAVKAGSVVRAVSPAYEVDARALQDGAAGGEIRLEFVSTRNRLRGRVVDAGRVDVVEGER